MSQTVDKRLKCEWCLYSEDATRVLGRCIAGIEATLASEGKLQRKPRVEAWCGLVAACLESGQDLAPKTILCPDCKLMAVKIVGSLRYVSVRRKVWRAVTAEWRRVGR